MNEKETTKEHKIVKMCSLLIFLYIIKKQNLSTKIKTLNNLIKYYKIREGKSISFVCNKLKNSLLNLINSVNSIYRSNYKITKKN